MILAKQSTARTVIIGPVLDSAGAAVTGGVVADFLISKNGAAPAALNGSATLTHRHTGFYSLALTASDLDTLGTAEVTIDDTTNACALKEIMVLPADVWDALVGGTEFLPVDGYKQEFSITSTTLQPKKPDGTTNTGYSRTLATDAAAEPIISST